MFCPGLSPEVSSVLGLNRTKRHKTVGETGKKPKPSPDGGSPPKVSQASEACTAAVDAWPPTTNGEATGLPGSLSLELQRHLEAGGNIRSPEPPITNLPNNPAITSRADINTH